MTAWELLTSSSLPAGEPEILLGYLFGKDKEYVLTHSEIGLSDETIDKFKILEKKRLAGWSIAVLIGEKSFYGLDFMVDKNVLVPRPETEMIIDEVINIHPESPLVVDLGTGSGAIIISLALCANLNNAQYIGVDISSLALRVAEANLARHNLSSEVKLIRGDLLKPVLKLLTQRNLVIAANLPYLSKTQIAQSASIQKEPVIALDGGQGGLKYYRELLIQLSTLNYKSLNLYLEIDPSQSEKIISLVKRYLPQSTFEIKKDLAGFNRLFVIKS